VPPLQPTTRNNAYGAALALLARHRLTEAQLWQRLTRKGFVPDDVAAAVARCKAQDFLDDRLFASLYVAGARKAVGDARLRAELVRRGIDREAAAAAVAAAPHDEQARISAAYEKIVRANPTLAFPAIARRLERLGFGTALVYRLLRERAHDAYGAVLGDLS
jgi:regulatory protein